VKRGFNAAGILKFELGARSAFAGLTLAAIAVTNLRTAPVKK
jgi:hypothetical protein